VGDREKEILDAKSYIQKAGYQVLNGSIPEKPAYRQSHDIGKAVTEVSFPTLKARAEELAQSIIDKLKTLKKPS
jgi:chromosome partitioning protein